MKIQTDIKGVEDVLKNIKALDDDIRKNAIQNVLRAGIKPIFRTAKSLAGKSKRTGQLQKSIGVSIKKIRRGANKGNYTARVGPRTGFATTIERNGKSVRIDPVKYANIVEYGTTRTAAKPFIRPAVESNAGTALQLMATALEKHIDRALKRRAKRRGISK